MLKILPFDFFVLNNKALFCLFNNTFFSFIFHSKMLAHTAEKDQIKYFAQSCLGKIALFYEQSAAWLSCCCHKLLSHH